MESTPYSIARRLTYHVWREMRMRCSNPSNSDYPNYGGRGIVVCDRWSAFNNFLDDMGAKPDGYSIDRLDVNGNYEPSNCKWIPLSMQSATRRSVKRCQQAAPEILRLRGDGLSQDSIAVQVGVHQATVSRILASHGMRSRVNDGRKWRLA